MTKFIRKWPIDTSHVSAHLAEFDEITSANIERSLEVLAWTPEKGKSLKDYGFSRVMYLKEFKKLSYLEGKTMCVVYLHDSTKISILRIVVR